MHIGIGWGHFTGKERDSESGNDYFGARYYASAMGRWLSPDWNGSPVPVPYADFTNPQTLNLYAYVSNNPLRRNDPTGHAAKTGPIELRSGTMRVDTASADQVNVHVFPKSGGEFRGRLNPDTRTIEWTKGAPPKAIAEEAQGWLISRNKYALAAVKREMSVLGGNRGAGEGEASGGSRLMEAGSWFLAIAGIADTAINEYQRASVNKLEGTTGFHIDMVGQYVVTDLGKFGDTFGAGAKVSADGDVFTLQKDGTWTDHFGQQLYQDSSGIHIRPGSA